LLKFPAEFLSGTTVAIQVSAQRGLETKEAIKRMPSAERLA
jgi:hypothetical protein